MEEKYRPIEKHIVRSYNDPEKEDEVDIYYKDGEVVTVTREEADKIIPVSKNIRYGGDQVIIVENFKDGSTKTYELHF